MANQQKKDPQGISKDERKQMMRALGLLTQMGLTFAICVLLGVLIGRFLDDFLGTSPWLLLVFAFLGVGAAFKTMYDIAQRF